MEASFEDMIAKWSCKESRDAALAWLKLTNESQEKKDAP
jgi:hypothetical protein